MTRIRVPVACILMIVVMTMADAQDSPGAIEYLGVPVRAVVYGNSHGLTVGDPAAGSETFYIPYYSTSGSSLVGYDHVQGKTLDIALGSSGGYGVAQGGDGALYVGGVNPGNLYRYDPATGELDNLGGAEHGNSYIWACATSPDGRKVYGACYPTAGVVEYDIDTRKLAWLGTMVEGEQYARSIEVDPQGRVWVGIGTHAHLIVFDPRTGEKRDVLPAAYRGNSSVYDLKRNGRYICASVIYKGDTLVYDTQTDEIVATIPPAANDAFWMNTTGGDDDTFYLYSSPGGSVYAYDRVRGELTKLVEAFGQACQIVDGRWLYGIDDQEHVKYDLAEGRELLRQHIGEARDGMAIMCLASDATGSIYGPTYINMHLFGYKPSTGGLHDLGKINRWGGQGDSISRGRDGRLYIGAYVRATANIYDPKKPWQPGEGPEANPRCYGPIGEGQYRTRCIEHGPDGMVYIGSVPSYNSAPMGAFTRLDPATGEKRIWTDMVPGGAVNKMASDDRYVFCAAPGRLFAFDTQTQEKSFETQLAVSALAATPDGQIACSLGDTLRVLDPANMEFTCEVATPTGALTDMITAPNGKLYGINAASIVEIDPATWTARAITTEGGSFLAADTESNLYFARGEKLLRFVWR